MTKIGIAAIAVVLMALSGCGEDAEVSTVNNQQQESNDNSSPQNGENQSSSTNQNRQNQNGDTGDNDSDDNARDDNEDEELPDQELCDELCDQVYNTCEFAFAGDGGNTATEQECYDECVDGVFEGQEQCVIDAGCSEYEIEQCLVGSSGDDNDEETPEPSDDLDDPCDPETEWPSQWEDLEDQVLVLTNERRAEGAVCGDQSFDPAPPLENNDILRCAARRHSQDMVDREYFSHYSPDGESPADRLADAGYTGSNWGENIAYNPSTAEQVVQGWMDSPGHCANIMRADFNEIGVGFADDPASTHRRMWTQKFGYQ